MFACTSKSSMWTCKRLCYDHSNMLYFPFLIWWQDFLFTSLPVLLPRLKQLSMFCFLTLWCVLFFITFVSLWCYFTTLGFPSIQDHAFYLNWVDYFILKKKSQIIRSN
jgi:hypothetical protein